MIFSLPVFSPSEWALVALIGIFVGCSKAGLPGIGLLTVPLMTEVFSAKQSTGVLLPMLVIADICAVIYYHRHADWKKLFPLFPPTILGIIAGYLAMGEVNDQQFKVLIGVMIMVLGVIMLLNKYGYIAKDKIPEGKYFAWAAGFLVGVTTMMANAAGPVAAIYLLALRMDKIEFIGTNAWFFLLVNIFKLPFSYHLGFIDSHSLNLNLIEIPMIILGIFIGIKIVKKVSDKVFLFLVIGLTFFSAFRMLM